MIFSETKLPGAFVIDIERIEDARGFFARAWCRREFAEHGLSTDIAQANTSFSKRRGTLRGMHFQVAPHEEDKVIRCIRGALYDVIIDLRPASATYKSWIGVELTAESRRMLYVPKGLAHGFLRLRAGQLEQAGDRWISVLGHRVPEIASSCAARSFTISD